MQCCLTCINGNQLIGYAALVDNNSFVSFGDWIISIDHQSELASAVLLQHSWFCKKIPSAVAADLDWNKVNIWRYAIRFIIMCALCNISLNWHHFFKGGSGGVGNQNMAHMGQYPQDGENGQNVAFFLELCCDQTVWIFPLFSTVLKWFWALHS